MNEPGIGTTPDPPEGTAAAAGEQATSWDCGVADVPAAPARLGTARWVRAASEPAYVRFRGRCDLSAVNGPALLQIAAHGRYRCFLNGHLVGDGPRRGDPPTLRTFRVDELVQPGTNVVAIELHQGMCPRRPSIIGAVMCALSLDGQVVLVSDGTWQQAPGDVWIERVRSNVPGPAGDHRIELPGATFLMPIEIQDLRQSESGWRTGNDDGERWRPVVPGPTVAGAPVEPDPAAAESLKLALPRRVVRCCEAMVLSPEDPAGNPALRMDMEPHRDCVATRIVGADGLTDPAGGTATFSLVYPRTRQGFYDCIAAGDGPPMVADATVILDFGRLINGHFALDIAGPAGTTIDIGYGQLLVGGRVQAALYGGNHEHGNKVDRVILAGERVVWRGFHRRHARFVQLTVRRQTGPVLLHQLALIERTAPLAGTGTFACEDPVLTRLWAATRRTVQTTTHDLFLDNAIREEQPWGGECGTRSLMTTWVTTGNTALGRHFIRQFTRFPEKKRFLCPRADGEQKDFFFHPLQLWHCLGRYRLYARPEDYAEDEVLPSFRCFVEHITSLFDRHGLIGEQPGIWLDWVPHSCGQGHGLPQNLFFALVLRQLAEAEAAAGEEARARTCLDEADRICKKMDALCWVPQRGLYADASVDGQPVTERFTEHANALALLAGLGGTERAAQVLATLARGGSDLVQCDAPFTHFLLEACFLHGQDGRALDLMRRRFGPMLGFTGLDSLWEERSPFASLRCDDWHPRYRSLDQSASAVPAWLLSTMVLGVRPTEPGFRRFDVRPQTGGLDWAAGTVPTLFGDIAVRWERDGEMFTLHIEVPEGTNASAYLPLGDCRVDGRPASLPGDGGYQITRLGSGFHVCNVSREPS